MTSILTVSPSPHVRSSMTTQKIMLLVVLALVPAIVAATVVFGPRALLLVVFCAVVSMFTAIVITKFLLHQMVGMKISNPWLYGIKARKEAQ